MLKLFVISALLMTSSHIFAFDHEYRLYEEALSKFVSKKDHQTLVNYKGLKSNSEDFSKVIRELSGVSQSEYNNWDEFQKLAFLINSYNAFTLKLIIDHYPQKSIKDIGGLFSNPWKKKFFVLLEEKNFLDNIEHNIIRKKFKEPRIHFAVNCASIGCPSLLPIPFKAKILDEQLSKVAKNFLENKNKNYYDSKKDTLYLSKIFKWYGDDFKKMTGVDFKDYIKKYFPGYNPDRSDISWLDYDWNLNETKLL